MPSKPQNSFCGFVEEGGIRIKRYERGGVCSFCLDKGNSAVPKWYPGKLTWNLRIQPWKKKIIFQTIIFRFYVNLRGCIEKKTGSSDSSE